MMPGLSQSFNQHRLYSDFLQVKLRLLQHQFICWVAGGAVRDLFLGREVDDFDLVTDASTEALKVIFPEAITVGESFGVLKIPLKTGEIFDLATFRQESDYTDGRRPSAVSASTPTEDAKRRDFSINALYWDDQNQRLLDYVGGVSDLVRPLLTCVGDPMTRFTEDHLRMIRLIRFGAQLRFPIETATEKAALQLMPNIDSVSGERIWIEFKKLALARHWDYVLKAPLFHAFIREIFNFDMQTLPRPNIAKAEAKELEDLFFMITQFSIPRPQLRNILINRLKLSKAEMNSYDLMVYARTQVSAESVFSLALKVEKKPELIKSIRYLGEVGEMHSNLASEIELTLARYPDALIRGDDLNTMIQGPRIGQILDEVRVLQFQGKVSTKDQALQLISMKK